MKWHSCDDGNRISGDGCDANCMNENIYWQCSGGSQFGPDICSEVCGDGKNHGTFANECDDHNILSGDGCNATCFIETGYYCVGGSNVARDFCFEICGDGLYLG
ncbi:MAG: hypothetical protein IPK55_13760 [Streptococcus sp.]|nr:hypothetical protein [Streptococcus sp.]